MSDIRTDTAGEPEDHDVPAGVDSEPDAVGGTSTTAVANEPGAHDDMTSVNDPDGTDHAVANDAIDAGVVEPLNRSDGSGGAEIGSD